MHEFDDVVLQCFLDNQEQLFPEPVANSLEEAEEKAEEWGELSIYAGIDAYLSYFCEERR